MLLDWVSNRLGEMISHVAIATKTPKKKPRRIKTSLSMMNIFIGNHLNLIINYEVPACIVSSGICPDGADAV